MGRVYLPELRVGLTDVSRSGQTPDCALAISDLREPI